MWKFLSPSFWLTTLDFSRRKFEILPPSGSPPLLNWISKYFPWLVQKKKKKNIKMRWPTGWRWINTSNLFQAAGLSFINSPSHLGKVILTLPNDYHNMTSVRARRHTNEAGETLSRKCLSWGAANFTRPSLKALTEWTTTTTPMF